MAMEVCREYIGERYDGQLSFLELKNDNGNTVVQVTLGSPNHVSNPNGMWRLEGIVKDPQYASCTGVGKELLMQLKNVFQGKIYVSPHPGNTRWINTLREFEKEHPSFVEVRVSN